MVPRTLVSNTSQASFDTTFFNFKIGQAVEAGQKNPLSFERCPILNP